jgi:teichuronic acid biosynthesis glycosyltransferase TuaC
MDKLKRVLVISFLYPSDAQPLGGVFIRERMKRVSEHLPITVVSPQPWSPIDWIVRRFVNKKYRPSPTNRNTNEDGFEVYRPIFLSLPSIGRWFDGYSMALSVILWLRVNSMTKLFNLVDAHFVFPEGAAAKLVSSYLGVPYGITLRGARDTDTVGTNREPQLRAALKNASYTIGVSDSLRQFAIKMEAQIDLARAIPNGINQAHFFPEDQATARSKLALDPNAKIIISVGSLIPLKGHDRVVALVPNLLKTYPNLLLLIVGGATGFGDTEAQIQELVKSLNLEKHVRLIGKVNPQDLRWYLSAADLFALATSNEGWPNAVMEAIACGLPIVTTNVGGNAEMVHDPLVGYTVKYWEPQQFQNAIIEKLSNDSGREYRLNWIAQRTWTSVGRHVATVLSAAIDKAAAQRHRS